MQVLEPTQKRFYLIRMRLYISLIIIQQASFGNDLYLLNSVKRCQMSVKKLFLFSSLASRANPELQKSFQLLSEFAKIDI